MTRADAWVTLGEGGCGRVGAADASLVFPQTLVIHSVSASFSWLLLRYKHGKMTLEVNTQTNAQKLLRPLTFWKIFSISKTIQVSWPHQVGVETNKDHLVVNA